ncbi:MAG: hypothetical protein U1E65_13385 [Myxococcota bacterium]
MKKTKQLLAVGLSLATWALAGCDAQPSAILGDEDSGTTVATRKMKDTGTVGPDDANTSEVVDVGSQESPDTGAGFPDAADQPDLGMVFFDASDFDLGVQMTDSGFGPADTGVVDPPDAGVAVIPDVGPRDAGFIWIDGGFIVPDSGVPPDSGLPEPLCQSCTRSSQCNQSDPGAFCVDDPAGGSVCGISCASSADCPNGFDCYSLVDSNGFEVGANCFPSNNGSCVVPDAGVSDAGFIWIDGGFIVPDGGSGPPPPDAGAAMDAGFPDTGIRPDSGVHPDAGPPDSGVRPDSGVCTDTWTNYAQTFFSNNCAGCHSNYGSYSGVANDGRVQPAIDSGSMPRGRSLSASSIRRIDAWFSCGMPR